MPRQNLREVGDRIEAILAELRSASPPVAEKAETLVRLLMDLYGAGLARVVEIVGEAGEAGARVLDRMAADPLLASLLILHDLHPLPLEARIQQALDRVRPYLGSHAGGVEFLGVDESGVVHLRLEGSCRGCPSSAVTVKLAIERAIMEAAPEVAGVEVEGMTVPPAQVRLFPGPPERGPAGEWVELAGLFEPGPGEILGLEVEGEPVILVRVGEALYAYRDRCPGCGVGVRSGRLEGSRLACPGCGEVYDVRLAGRSLRQVHLSLEPLPLLREGGVWKLAVSAYR